MEKRQLVGGHDEQAVGLRRAARHLGEELRPRHSDRDRQPDPLQHVAPQPHRDLDRRARQPAQSADVEERLVDREPLDERRRVLEHPEHRLARLGVGRHPRRDDDRTRAQPPGVRTPHRRADTEGLGLVARGEHDSSADDHGPAAQTRIVPLLDGRVERVHVGVEDRRRATGHEHMFARPSQERHAFLTVTVTVKKVLRQPAVRRRLGACPGASSLPA